MRNFIALSMIIVAVSCGRNTSGNGHTNQSQNALIVQGSINLRCSEQSVRLLKSQKDNTGMNNLKILDG